MLKYADVVLSISANDRAHFQKYGRSVYVPAFSPDIKFPVNQTEVGYGILYHGNLSVSENIKAVLYLLDNVFSKIDLPVTIAGKKPADKILKKAAKLPNVKVVANPSEPEMLELVSKAQINILITFQSTGIKLKLLTALQYGKHCIVNNEMIEKTGLSNTCCIANTPNEIITAIYKLHSLPFGAAECKERQRVLSNLYSNTKSAKTILELL
ncbi:glycosyltransferase family 4 protein [Pontibacter cellulosilyticus]|uniref:Glycosyltransferase n=1 Tax=Pontibacter cellulosilyticus TaxID=1720253 RepID=A0A923N5J3_9BACT|nr:glycosyltransferase family 4 protein [Pontibacter cellulosilyticus]MBC5992142.1 glycosyltransferase [Pontibacter cellulosilyticus]